MKNLDNSVKTKIALSSIRINGNSALRRYKSATAVPTQNDTLCSASYNLEIFEQLKKMIDKGNKTLPLEVKAMLELMLVGGARVSEVVNLDYGNVLNDGRILIFGLKGSDNRIIAPGAYLDFWIRFRKLRLSIPDYYSRFYLHRILIASGVFIKLPNSKKKSVAHGIRYAYVYNLIQNGLSITDIQKALGHKSIRNTKLYINNIKAYEEKKH